MTKTGTRRLLLALCAAASALVAGPSHAETPRHAETPPHADTPQADTPEARYESCMALAREKPEAALAAARDWYAAKGGFPAQHCAAVALVGLKRYAEAARHLEDLAAAMMGAEPALRADALEEAGQAWLLDRQAAAAKADFDSALQLRPDDPDLLIGRAQSFAEGGQFRQAVADLDRALASDPNRADALVYRASAERRIDALDKALIDIDRALKLAPGMPTAYLERGNIRQLAGDPDGARADWRQVEKLAPGSAAAAAARANLAHGDAPANR